MDVAIRIKNTIEKQRNIVKDDVGQVNRRQKNNDGPSTISRVNVMDRFSFSYLISN